MHKQKTFLACFALLMGITAATGQTYYRAQQRVEYEMDIKMNVQTNQFTGTQKIVFYNNTDDQLDKVFYHLYFNAFQPNSMMDVRSRALPDADPRVADRISKLKPEEIGYTRVKSLKQDGVEVKFEENETILEVRLAKPVAPKSKTVLEMTFESQVPIQIRRNGRDNAEGIRYSMSQWYPKLCNYDEQGWHANPYIGREFYGIWGDFDVKITIDKNYVVAGTGYLQNPNEIGHGYQDVGIRVDNSAKTELTWHFKAPNVHDFAWAADPDYAHDVVEVNDTFKLHFFYENKDELRATWQKAQGYMQRAYKIIQPAYGAYPYRQYSFIQGGDGGMEYPMATLITGKRQLGSLVGVMVHEAMHTWFQMLMGSNEALHAWMDEGFTSFSSSVVMYNIGLGGQDDKNIHHGSYAGYYELAKSIAEEPLTTHADHFQTNFGYGAAAYDKGSVFLKQLEYIIGEKAFNEGMLSYYKTWRFRHPNPNDFIRVMEKQSGLELDWYKEYWVNTIHTIDYKINSVAPDENDKKGSTKITLERYQWNNTAANNKLNGGMPMPIEVLVEYKVDKDKTAGELFYIPLDLMRGEKQDEAKFGKRTVMKDWRWVDKNYELVVSFKTKEIVKVTIDPSLRMADIQQDNNVYAPK